MEGKEWGDLGPNKTKYLEPRPTYSAELDLHKKYLGERNMPLALSGSTWKKWDLHVHTPESFYHNYPGTREEAWEAFLKDIENLPEEFKVIGINDYVLVDGYERVLKEKREQERLKNIDLILPVVELRLDKFGGVVQGGKKENAPSARCAGEAQR